MKPLNRTDAKWTMLAGLRAYDHKTRNFRRVVKRVANRVRRRAMKNDLNQERLTHRFDTVAQRRDREAKILNDLRVSRQNERVYRQNQCYEIIATFEERCEMWDLAFA